MTERRINIHRQFNSEKLLPRLNDLNKTLQRNYGKDLLVTNTVLDELYDVIFFCLESKNKENKAALLEAAENLKFAYGLALEEEKIRPYEYLYWREIVFAALSSGEFQTVEYLVESSRNLLRIFADQRPFIVDTLKMIANMSMQERKPFVASAVFDVLMYRLQKLDKENKKTAAAVIGCLASIGLAALKFGDIAFFKEICALLSQNIGKVNIQEEAYWDKLIISWLRLCLDNALYDSYNDWRKLFRVYRKLRLSSSGSFYADMIDLLQQKILQADIVILRNLLADILKHIWLQANYMECLLCVQALGGAYKKIVKIITWEKTAFLFQPLFLLIVQIAENIDKKDKKAALRQAFLDLLLPEIGSAAALSLPKFNCDYTLQLLFYWREFFLKKFPSEKRQKSMKRFWLLVAECWKEKNFPADNNDEARKLLAMFY